MKSAVFKKPKPLVPTARLKSALQSVLSHHFGETLSVHSLRRRVSDYCSSYLIEELDVTLSNDQTLQLVFKDLSPRALISTARDVKPDFLYEPLREIECYRALLAPHELGTAKCYGAVVEEKRARFWLFLERVPPALLWQMGDFSVWIHAAQWLAGAHTYLAQDIELRRPPQTMHLIQYDEKHYWRWMRRAQRFVRHGDTSQGKKSAAAIDWIAERYGRAVERLTKLPRTLIHGEFYPSNVMVDQGSAPPRICPVDWEMAAIGPGLMDLAALTSGGWSPAQKKAMATAYLRALGNKPRIWKTQRAFLSDLDHCRLHQAVALLGWSENWTPPPEHKFNWLAEAVRLAETLGL
jgi:hypothetical protein